MVSLATRKTFEMVLVVSFESWDLCSRLMSNDTLVLSFTIIRKVRILYNRDLWMRKGEYASGF